MQFKGMYALRILGRQEEKLTGANVTTIYLCSELTSSSNSVTVKH